MCDIPNELNQGWAVNIERWIGKDQIGSNWKTLNWGAYWIGNGWSHSRLRSLLEIESGVVREDR